MPRKRIAIDFRPVSPPVGVFLSRPSVGLAISPLLHIEDIYWLFLFFSSFFWVLPQGKNCISAVCTPLQGLARRLAEADTRPTNIRRRNDFP